MDTDSNPDFFGVENALEDKDTREFVVFCLGNSFFGIDIEHVREIIVTGPVTPAPLSPEYVKGVYNLRGQIVTIVDLAQRLQLDSREGNDRRRYIVVEFEGEKIGLLVDCVQDVVEVDATSIKNPPASLSKLRSAWFSGVLRMENGVVGILNLQKVLAEEGGNRK